MCCYGYVAQRCTIVANFCLQVLEVGVLGKPFSWSEISHQVSEGVMGTHVLVLYIDPVHTFFISCSYFAMHVFRIRYDNAG